MDRHSTTRLFAYRLLMVEETNHSSSLSWLSTSRRWWIVWILENQWQSSETFPASLGWRKVTNRMEEEDKEKFQCCPDSSGTTLYFRVLQGHFGRNLMNPSSQDNVVILDGIFEFFNHVGYAIKLHSIINSGLIPGGQNLSNRQTVFFLFVDPLDKERKHLDTIELEAPRLAHPCGKHGRDIRILCIGRHQHCSEERIEVSDTIERHHPLRNNFQLIVSRKLFGWKLEKS